MAVLRTLTERERDDALANKPDDTSQLLKRYGEPTLKGTNIIVMEDGGRVVAAACGSAEGQDDTAVLGEFIFETGGITLRANLAAFRDLLRAHVEEAIALGFPYGRADVRDVRVVRFVERTFGIKAVECGFSGGAPSRWQFTVTLADFLKVI